MSLYWKLFASITLAMTVTLVGAVFVSFRLAEQAFEQSRTENRSEIIGQASAALTHGGIDGLREWLQENRRPSVRTLLLIIDESGGELLDWPIPGYLRRNLPETQGGRAMLPSNYRPQRFAPRLIGSDGRDYYLYFTRPPRTLFGVLNWPSTQAAVVTLAIIVAALTALILARYISLPVVRLQRAARALAIGEFGTRVGKPFHRRHDEVGTLARDFDKMAEQIQNLVTGQETLLRDVSHELRSPLARIRMALALAERDTVKDAVRDKLTRIEEETERLDRLVGQILALARLRAPAPAVHHHIRLDKLLEEVAADASFEKPKVRITQRISYAGIVSGDPLQLHSAVENVVRNAVSFAGDDGEVELELRRDGDQIRVRVTDTGPGVDDCELTKIFEPFYRTDPSRDHRRKGEGIGLAITAGVIERHGGRCEARNRAAGGLEVILSLPAANAS
ncbi:MAG TPA: ATP-binding protein [Gammaproteobacteria bacterium]|nr:ATP-binding protein [Gammaproteobacteria bacterium]